MICSCIRAAIRRYGKYVNWRGEHFSHSIQPFDCDWIVEYHALDHSACKSNGRISRSSEMKLVSSQKRNEIRRSNSKDIMKFVFLMFDIYTSDSSTHFENTWNFYAFFGFCSIWATTFTLSYRQSNSVVWFSLYSLITNSLAFSMFLNWRNCETINAYLLHTKIEN